MAFISKILQLLQYIPEAWRIGKAIYDIIVGKKSAEPLTPEEEEKEKKKPFWRRRRRRG